jgi:hypothetical protein
MHRIHLLLIIKAIRVALSIYLLTLIYKMTNLNAWNNLSLLAQFLIVMIYMLLLCEFYFQYIFIKKDRPFLISGAMLLADTAFQTSSLAVFINPSITSNPLDAVKGIFTVDVILQIVELAYSTYLEYQIIEASRWHKSKRSDYIPRPELISEDIEIYEGDPFSVAVERRLGLKELAAKRRAERKRKEFEGTYTESMYG